MNFVDNEFFVEISDFAVFVEVDRKNHGNESKLSTYDYVLINIVKHLACQQKNLIHIINSDNFKSILNTLIKIDAKISNYLFFLNNFRFESDKEVIECIQSVEKTSLDDYYCGLSFSNKLNNYKLIICN
ncbi:DUF7006 family protein [Enterococcus gallinarum]|uniref:DUF7006 family protein n=1 Tax=Enterococcus gallinarum TaxID=1353 RepID=UPI0028916381|nr:hypothetical protein [Enterococcus gallinarum]MDT2680471.1 hypothetical protein [Enterococcus gallinarum]MDT2683729.1 hypothetical protein [Enterococcus gallinarum]